MAIAGGGFAIGAAPAGLGTLMFRMQLAGFDEVKVSLSRFGERIKNFKPFWLDYVAPTLYRDIRRNFETQGSYVGGWRPLDPGYASWKAKHYPGKTILRRTDALFRSLSFDGSQAGAGGIFVADETTLVVGTSIPYAQYHQFGDKARRFLFLPKQARSIYGRLLHAFAIDQADQEGLHVAVARARSTGGGLL